jgi:hypothetical protein
MNMPNTIAINAMILRALKLRVGICTAEAGKFGEAHEAVAIA